MTSDFQDGVALDPLFERLLADPASLPAFEEYARAVEAAVRRGQDLPPELAETLARHLETLPALAESRLETALDEVSRGLLASSEFERLRSARALEEALDKAREQLQARHPRVEGRSPAEFVRHHRNQPLRILDVLEADDLDWLRPHVNRCRGIMRRSQDVPGDTDMDSSLAAALAEVGELCEHLAPRPEPEVAFRAALLYDPGQAAARAGLGQLALSYGREQEAELEFRAALDRDPGQPRALAGLGQLMLRDGRVGDARDLSERLLAEHASRIDGYLLAGLVELADGRVPAAVAHLQEAVELDPDHPRPLRLLAGAYARAGHGALAASYQEAAGLRAAAELPALWEDAAPASAAALPPELLQPPPPPPRPGATRVVALGPLGPLTRDEAFAAILATSLEQGQIRPDATPVVLRARGELRITRERFDELYEQVLADPATADDLEPRALFEELRRRAWRDGVLSADERDVLEAVVRVLGIDRRAGTRDRVD